VGEISRSQTVVRKPDIRVRRVYGQPSPADGTRILVDSIWPGADESRAELGEWCKQVAPSTAMRKWYDHDPERFEEFSRRYRAELEDRAGEGVAAPMEVGQGPNRDAPDRDQRPRDQPGRGACRPAPGLTPGSTCRLPPSVAGTARRSVTRGSGARLGSASGARVMSSTTAGMAVAPRRSRIGHETVEDVHEAGQPPLPLARPGQQPGCAVAWTAGWGACGHGTAHLDDQCRPTATEVWRR
jgi:uncharacterized protein YeaO (DUF488 family)